MEYQPNYNEINELFDPGKVDEWLQHPPSSFINFMTDALRDEVATAESAMRDALKPGRLTDPAAVVIDSFEDLLRSTQAMNQILQMGKAYQDALNEMKRDRQ